MLADVLVVVGATDIAVHLCRMANDLGLRVTVVDPRSVFATPERFPGADEIVRDWPDEAFGKVAVDADTFVVTLTHDPKFDLPTLRHALRSDAAYIGALGSTRTHARREQKLRELGFNDAELARIRAPIGLDLGADGPHEIALAILAEILAMRSRRDGRSLSNRREPGDRSGS